MSDDRRTVTVEVTMNDWETDFRNLVENNVEFQWCFPIMPTGELIWVKFVQEPEEDDSSPCCGATIIRGDLCSACMEHCV